MTIPDAPGADAAAARMAQDGIKGFAKGLGGRQPDPDAVRLATDIANAALSPIPHPDVLLDADGELSFDLRRPAAA